MRAATPAGAVPARPSSLPGRLAWHWRHDPKVDLWLAWYTMVCFYNLFGIVFVGLTRVMPPPKPWWDTPRVLQWFTDNHDGLLWGFGICFLVAGLTSAANALIGYSMRRMSVSRAFTYAYIGIYSLSAIPGMLVTAILLSVAAMRPQRSPELIHALYEAGFMCFVGTMGVFLVGTLVWMIAILIDRNRVFPKWFAYLNICNLLTEVVVAPVWIMRSGPFAWNGAITFWIDTIVFVIYTAVFITLLMKMIQREDFGDGVLPEGPRSDRRLGNGRAQVVAS